MKLFPLVATFALATQAWAADAQLIGLLMPESKLIAGVQLQQTKASPFGQFLLSQLGANADLNKLRSMTGFDPLTDFTEMVVSATLDGKGLVAGRGNFQPQLLTMMAAMAGFPTETYRGVALIGAGQAVTLPNLDPVVVFLNGSIVLMGDRALIKGSVDRWLAASTTPSPLVAVVNDIGSSSQAWAVATGLSQLTPGTKAPSTGGAPPQAAMLQNVLDRIDHIAGGLTFAETVTVRGQAVTKSPQDAQALAAVVQLMTSMSASKAPLPFTPQVTASGSAVNFTLSVTEQQLEDLIKPAGRLRASR